MVYEDIDVVFGGGSDYHYRLNDGNGGRIAGNLRENPAFASDSRGGGTFRYRRAPDDVRGDSADDASARLASLESACRNLLAARS